MVSGVAPRGFEFVRRCVGRAARPLCRGMKGSWMAELEVGGNLFPMDGNTPLWPGFPLVKAHWVGHGPVQWGALVFFCRFVFGGRILSQSTCIEMHGTSECQNHGQHKND